MNILYGMILIRSQESPCLPTTLIPLRKSLTTEPSDGQSPVVKPWDTSDPFFTAQSRDMITLVFKCYIRLSILHIGIPGNVLCCVIFWKQGLSDRINLLLFWLAVTDFLSVGTQLPLTCYVSDATLVSNLLVVSFAVVSRVNLCCSGVSGALIVVMSVERCLSVLMPLKARRLLTYRPMAAAIFLSYLVPFLLYLPWFFAHTVRWRVDPSTNRSVAYMVSTSWFPSDAALITNYFVIIGQPVCFTIVVVCNSITVIYLRRSSRKRSEMTGKTNKGGKSEDKITIMLLVVSCVYSILLTSQICAYIIRVFVPEFFPYKKYHNSAVVMYQVIFTSSCVNSTVNFFAYLALSSRFRLTFKELFSCFHRK